MNRQQELAAALEIVNAHRAEIEARAETVRALDYKERKAQGITYGPNDYLAVSEMSESRLPYLAGIPFPTPTSDYEAERLLAIAKEFTV